ncbi:unnamed protein product, partial [Rotaria sordida]
AYSRLSISMIEMDDLLLDESSEVILSSETVHSSLNASDSLF